MKETEQEGLVSCDSVCKKCLKKAKPQERKMGPMAAEGSGGWGDLSVIPNGLVKKEANENVLELGTPVVIKVI